MSEQTIKMVPIGKLKPDPDQPRTEWELKETREHIAGLAESFKEVGLIEPVVVDEDNVIILGECRWKAAKKAKLKKVPVRKMTIKNRFERLQLQLVEDVHKKELTELERRWAYAAAVASINDADRDYTVSEIKEIWRNESTRSNLHKMLKGVAGASRRSGQREMARRIGVSSVTINKLLRYFDEEIPDEARKAADRGLMSHDELGRIGRIKTPKTMKKLVKSVTKEREKGPKLAVSVSDRVDAIRKIEERGGSEELLVATAEAKIEPEDAEALAEVPVEAQPEAVKIVKAQPTSFARKVAARQIAVEVPSRAAEVKVSEKQIAKLKTQAEAYDRHMVEVRTDSQVIEAQRLYRSSTVFFGLQEDLKDAFCPVCNKTATEQLRFLCHPELNIDEVYAKTMEKHRQLSAKKKEDH